MFIVSLLMQFAEDDYLNVQRGYTYTYLLYARVRRIF